MHDEIKKYNAQLEAFRDNTIGLLKELENQINELNKTQKEIINKLQELTKS